MIRPVLAEIAGSCPSLFNRAQISAVRRSCQTMARCTAVPVMRSHTTVVSRWLVMPMAAMSLAGRRPCSAPRGRSRPSSSRCPPAHARPSPRPENIAGIRPAPTPRSRCRRETRWRARMWCPDRWPAHGTWCGFLALLPGEFIQVALRESKRIGEGSSTWACSPPPCGEGLGGGGQQAKLSRERRATKKYVTPFGFGLGVTSRSLCVRTPTPDPSPQGGGEKEVTPRPSSRRRRRRWSGRS